jgi:hypothetical protein
LLQHEQQVFLGGPSPSGLPHFVYSVEYVGRFVSGNYTSHIPIDTTSLLPETLDRKGRRRRRRRRALLRSRTTIRRAKFRRALTGVYGVYRVKGMDNHG